MLTSNNIEVSDMPGKSRYRKAPPSAASATAAAPVPVTAKTNPRDINKISEAELIALIKTLAQRLFEVVAALNSPQPPKADQKNDSKADIKQEKNNNAWVLIQNRYSLMYLVTILAKAFSRFMLNWEQHTQRKDWDAEQKSWYDLRNIAKHSWVTLPDAEFFEFIKILSPLIYQTLINLTRYSHPNQRIANDAEIKHLTLLVDFNYAQFDSLRKFITTNQFYIPDKAQVKKYKQDLTARDYYNFIVADMIPLINYFSQPILQETNSDKDVVLYDANLLTAICELIKEIAVYYTPQHIQVFKDIKDVNNPLKDETESYRKSIIAIAEQAKRVVANQTAHNVPVIIGQGKVVSAIEEKELSELCELAKTINSYQLKAPAESRLLRLRSIGSAPAKSTVVVLASATQSPVKDVKKIDAKAVVKYSITELKAAASLPVVLTAPHPLDVKGIKLETDLIRDINYIIGPHSPFIKSENIIKLLNPNGNAEFILNYKALTKQYAVIKPEEKDETQYLAVEIGVRIAKCIVSHTVDGKKSRVPRNIELFFDKLKDLKIAFKKIKDLRTAQDGLAKVSGILKNIDEIIKEIGLLKIKILASGFTFTQLIDGITLDNIKNPCLLIHSVVTDKLYDFESVNKFIAPGKVVVHPNNVDEKISSANIIVIEDHDFVIKYILGKMVLFAADLAANWFNYKQGILAGFQAQNATSSKTVSVTNITAILPSTAVPATQAPAKVVAPLFSQQKIEEKSNSLSAEQCKDLIAEVHGLNLFMNMGKPPRATLRVWHAAIKTKAAHQPVGYAEVVINLADQWLINANKEISTQIKNNAKFMQKCLVSRATIKDSKKAAVLSDEKFTLKSTIDKEIKNLQHQSLLHKDELTIALQKNIAAGKTIDSFNSSKISSLYMVIDAHNYPYALCLIDLGADMHLACGSQQKSSLALLEEHAVQGNIQAKALLEYYKRKVNQKITAAKLLPSNPQPTPVKDVKSSGAPLLVNPNEERGKKLRYAAVNEDAKVFETTVASYLDIIDHMGLSKKTALFFAIEGGRYNKAKILINNGANMQLACCSDDPASQKTPLSLLKEQAKIGKHGASDLLAHWESKMGSGNVFAASPAVFADAKSQDYKPSPQLTPHEKSKIMASAEEFLNCLKRKDYARAQSLLVSFAKENIGEDNLFNLILTDTSYNKSNVDIEQLICALMDRNVKDFVDIYTALKYFKLRDPENKKTQFYIDLEKNDYLDTDFHFRELVEYKIAYKDLFLSILEENFGANQLTIRQLLVERRSAPGLVNVLAAMKSIGINLSDSVINAASSVQFTTDAKSATAAAPVNSAAANTGDTKTAANIKLRHTPDDREILMGHVSSLTSRIDSKKYDAAQGLLVSFAKEKMAGDNLFNLILKMPSGVDNLTVKFFIARLRHDHEAQQFYNNFDTLFYFAAKKAPYEQTQFYMDMENKKYFDAGSMLHLLVICNKIADAELLNSILDEKFGLNKKTIRQLLDERKAEPELVRILEIIKNDKPVATPASPTFKP